MTTANETDRAARALRPVLTCLAWGAMTGVLLTALLPASLVARIAPYPFLLSVVFLGLPHGAWDHLVVAAARGWRLSLLYLAGTCLVYSALVLVYSAFWFAAPTAAFAAFIVVSWLHWGQGDAAYLRLFVPARADVPAWLTWLVRGGAPILLPIFRFPQEYARIAAGVTGLFDGTGTRNAAHYLPSPAVCAAGTGLLAVLAALYLTLLWRASPRGTPARRVAIEDCAEIVLLYVVFAVANPVLAVGVYFSFWHGLRHIGRLLILDETCRARCAAGRVGAAAARFAVQCLPILAASLLMLTGAYQWATRAGVGGASSALFVYLALIAALTFPHFLLVCWLDRQKMPERPRG